MSFDVTFAPASNYHAQGGALWVVGGVLQIASGGKIVPDSGTQAAAITALTDSTGGVAGNTLAATGPEQTIVIPCQLLDFINAGAITLALPFAFTVLSALFRTNKPATTAAKAATLTLSTSAGAVAGGVMGLTSANQNTQGGTVAASAISGANATVAAAGTIIVTASSVTTFVEGDGWVEITVSNNDLAAALASIAAKVNSLITACHNLGITG